MTLDQVRETIANFAPSIKRTPEQFETALNNAQLKYYRQLFDQGDERRQFKHVAGEATPPLVVINGKALLPSDYFRWLGAYHFVDHAKRRVRIVDDKAYNELVDSTIEYPTLEYAIANMQGDYMRVLPLGIQYVMLDYLSLPKSVVYGWDDSEGVVQYDPSSSVELDWDDYDIVGIIMVMLADIGIAVSRTQVEANDAKRNT